MNNRNIILGVLFLASMLFFMQGLSVHGPEYRDDEIFYFRSTQEMLRDNNLLSPTYFGENRFQKPILFYWLVILSYRIFGTTWFAARFVSVIFAGLTVCVTWLIARQLFDRKVAAISSMLLMTVPLFFRHAKNVVPDMALNFFIVFALYCALQCIRESGGQRRWRYLFFVSCGLGFMIKGFAALIVPVVALISYTLLINRADVLKKMNFATGTLVILAIALPWFAYMRWLHGNEYFQYMLQVETYNRMTSSAQQHMLVKLASTFVRNALFYLETLGSYFAPWSGLMLAAVPLAVVAVIKRRDPERSVLFAVNWFFAVFIFFSLIHARINHLILVLSTPFAIIVALFLLGYLDDVGVVKKIAVGFRRGMSCVILIGGLLGLSFVRVFLLGSTKLWLPVFLLIFVGAVYVIFYRRKPLATAILLCVFLLFSYSQAGLLSQARLTSHASLQGLAHTINQHINEDTVIGVGSHDIHEKELQVYFERQVEKAATSDDAETQALLRNLFTRDVAVYCILTEKDYQNLLDGDVRDAVAIVQREQIFRRRVTIDAGFFTALLALDRQAINRYLMETILLIRKEQHA